MRLVVASAHWIKGGPVRTLVRYLSSVLARLATGLLLLACAGVAVAQQGFPSKTIRIIVPFSPGGTNDILARVRGPKLTEVLGQ